MSNRDEYINGLRQLADWLEQHQDAAIPTYLTAVNVPLTDNASVEAHAAASGLDVAFGPVTYHAYGYADWDSWIVQHSEKRARAWADRNGMELRTRDAEEVAS